MNEHLDLANIIKGYYENKARLVSIVLAVFIFFIIYAFSIPNTYKAEIYLVPPEEKYVQPLNYFATQIAKDRQLILEQKFIYFSFMKNAQSRKYQRKYFYENELYNYFPNEEDREEIFKEHFYDNFRFGLESKFVSRDIRQEDFLNVSFVHTDPELASKWLNGFIKMVERETSKNIVDGVNASINNYSRKIQSSIDSKRKLAKKIKLDKIIQLKEALLTAEKLNIVAPSNVNLTRQSIFMDDGGDTGPTQLTEMPLYLLGSDALKSQINSLETRISDDPFIPKLRNLEEALDATSLIKVSYSDVKVAEIDQLSIVPKKKYAPKRSLMLALGLFLGILLAFLNLLFILFRKHQD